MSAVEAAKWAAYIKKRGPLNLAAHIEMAFAEMMALIVNRGRSRNEPSVSMKKFLNFYHPDRYEDEEATLDDIMGILTGAARNGK